MSKPIKFKEMLDYLCTDLDEIPEHRRGDNTRYEIAEAGLSAFAVFYSQSPSFLSHQRNMKRQKGKSNMESLFGVENTPSDAQIRNLLDPVKPSRIGPCYWQVYEQLDRLGHLEPYRHLLDTLCISLDGVNYFSSSAIHCDSCRVQVNDEKAHYTHQVLSAVLTRPEGEHVIALEPEFILPQDGHEKQDCEQEAIKRWVEKNASRFPAWEVTITTDDLHSHQPLCALLLDQQMHFLMTCKPQSHETLMTEVDLLERVTGGIQTETIRTWNGQFHEETCYRWAVQVPLKAGKDALHVNWIEATVVNAESGEMLYHNSWITSHDVDAETVVDLVEAGRAHWKVENENHNVLKNQGYNFDHNFGHGDQNLSIVFIKLLLFAFLMHTVLHMTSSRYQAIRIELGTRRTFFNDLRALTRYIYFTSWHQLITFMYQKLELEPD